MRVERLPPGVTMQLFRLTPAGEDPGPPLFLSSGRWLHPLFELEEFLAAHRGPEGDLVLAGGVRVRTEELFLRDRVIGTAAALLILRLGLREVETDLAGCRAIRLLRDRGVSIEAGRVVEAIGCATERLLAEETDPEAAYRLLAGRRARARGA